MKVPKYFYFRVNVTNNGTVIELKDASDADVVEVVRCKDCKHYEADITGNPWGVCCHSEWVTDQTGHDVDDSGWCYRAERREDGN